MSGVVTAVDKLNNVEGAGGDVVEIGMNHAGVSLPSGKEDYHSADEEHDNGQELEDALRMPPRLKRYGSTVEQMRKNKAIARVVWLPRLSV